MLYNFRNCSLDSTYYIIRRLCWHNTTSCCVTSTAGVFCSSTSGCVISNLWKYFVEIFTLCAGKNSFFWGIPDTSNVVNVEIYYSSSFLEGAKRFRSKIISFHTSNSTRDSITRTRNQFMTEQWVISDFSINTWYFSVFTATFFCILVITFSRHRLFYLPVAAMMNRNSRYFSHLLHPFFNHT